mmetsp:Transcript_11140/g.37932  ORF Transcript_11140/g.37932 Transcript_11140/m.37932 type:complete len:242 (+) Transcript_11140:31-756(+)
MACAILLLSLGIRHPLHNQCLQPARGLLGAQPRFPGRGVEGAGQGAVSRREVAFSAALLCGAALTGAPAYGAIPAPKRDEGELKESIVLILRVIEATQQEERLINTGKYKDLQRKSVKNAATMMLTNYALQKNIVSASVFVPQESVSDATRLGQEAVEALEQIVGYFPAELSVGELERAQKDFVLKALASARTNLQEFLKLMPQEVVRAAKAQVSEENNLNAKEYKEYFGEPMLNAPGPDQ